MLGYIERHIDRFAGSVLEIGFIDGIISKNLNYHGYDVTAVDRRKIRILNTIAGEWHDNVLQAGQEVAKFYHEPVLNPGWVKKIPEFEVIIVVGDQNLDTFEADAGQGKELLDLLLQKASKQLFIRVANTDGSSSSDSLLKDFTADDLIRVATSHHLVPEVIATEKDDEGREFQLCLVTKPPKPQKFSVPVGAEAEHSRSTILEVEMAKCLDSYGATYIGDWQPFVEVVKQYRENPDLQYEDSILREYYRRFQPRNQEEALFAQRGRAPKLRGGFIGFPWMSDKSRRVVFTKSPGETRPGGYHFFGPNTDEFGATELGRLVHLYRIFQKDGYHPELFSDGYIAGYMLIKGDDYRFVVDEGQHRVACLAALGYETIRCRFTQKQGYPRVVLGNNWSNLKQWPQVASGAYGRSLALKVFERYFADNVGRERMGL